MTWSKLEAAGLNVDDIEFAVDNADFLPNLQLLEGTPNEEKSAKPFDAWLRERYPEPAALRSYAERNYVPDLGLSVANFQEVFEARERLMLDRLAAILGVQLLTDD